MFVYHAIEQAIKYNIDYKVLYYLLEESEDEFKTGLLSYLLYRKHGTKLSPLSMMSYSTSTFSKDTLEKIEDCQVEFELYMSYIQVKDYLYTPYSIYKDVMDYARKHGDHYYIHKNTKEIKVLEDKQVDWFYHHYTPYNPDAYVSVIVDHISLLQESKDPYTGLMMTKHQTLGKWSTAYMRNVITKKLNYMAINVQQQSAQAENVEHVKQNMMIPSLSNLGDN